MKNVLSVAAVSLAVTAVFALSVTPAFAESSKKLTDDADIITSSQEETIENNLKKCTLDTGWDTIIYTNNNNVDSYDMEEYCNDYFDNHDYGCGDEKSGVFLTVDMSSREMYIITKDTHSSKNINQIRALVKCISLQRARLCIILMTVVWILCLTMFRRSLQMATIRVRATNLLILCSTITLLAKAPATQHITMLRFKTSRLRLPTDF